MISSRLSIIEAKQLVSISWQDSLAVRRLQGALRTNEVHDLGREPNKYVRYDNAKRAWLGA